MSKNLILASFAVQAKPADTKREKYSLMSTKQHDIDPVLGC